MKRVLRVAGIVCGVSALMGILMWVVIDPHLERAETYPGGRILRDAAGDVLRVSLGEGDVDCRPYYTAAVDDWIVKALVASEDRRFFEHGGVDVWSVLRACWQNVTALRRVSGASTLSMQAARLIQPHPRTLFWKCVEAVRAVKMERVRSKLWIVTQYLNRAPFGSNFVGIEAAAHGWFGKSAKSLGLGEAALLAGMVQSPSRFRPDRHFDRALKRRQYVLGRMHEQGLITSDQYAGALQTRPQIRRAPRPFKEPFYCDWAARELTAAGRMDGDVVLALEPDIQHRAVHTATAAAQAGRAAAAVVMRVSTGEIVALACSGDYFSARAGQVNTALSARSAGSTLKPFLVALALDRGQVTPDERLADVPKAYRGYNPVNFDARHRGAVKVSDALVLSLNLPFVQLLQRVGVSRFGTALRSLGCRQMRAADDAFGLGMAIGNVNVTLVELVGAYGALARGGVWLEPTPVRTAAGRRDGLRVFSEGVCWIVSDILSRDQRAAMALGHMADVRTSRFAWKTGTSSAFRDAWTVAWNPDYVVGVWCGHLSGGFGDSRIVGGTAAAPHCWNLARSLYPAHDGPWFVRPKDVSTCVLCAESGLPASPDCPQTETGWLLDGRSSRMPCERHRRGLDGDVQTVGDAYVDAFSGAAARARNVAISRPNDGSVYRIVKGIDGQRIVCTVVGNTAQGRLWWFVDGRALGETTGTQPFVWTPEPGTHRISCSTADGVAAAVRVTVIEE